MSWGEIYNTSWWGVALDTARTVKARPDFFGSQLNLLTSEQPNLVTNGTFDTDSDWSLGTGWSISGGKASFDKNIGGSGNIEQNIGIVIGNTYKLHINTLESNGGNIAYSLGGGFVFINQVLPNNIYTIYVTATSPIIRLRGSSNFIGSIDNVSVQVARAELDQIEAKKCLADWIHTTALKDLNN